MKQPGHKYVLLAGFLTILVFFSSCTPAAKSTTAPASPEATTIVAPANNSTGDTSTETKIFKLGVLGPFTGPAALTGQEFKNAVELAFQEANYKIGPYTVELVWIDEQGDPSKAAQAYEEAVVKKGIQAGILNWQSSIAVSVMEVTAKYEIPHFFTFGGSDTVNETWQSNPEKYYYWLKGWPSPYKLSGIYVQAIEDAIQRGLYSPKDKTVAIWGEDTDWARSFGKGIREQFTNEGWQILSEDYFPVNQTDFVPLLTKVNTENPAVFAGTSAVAPIFSSLIKQAEQVGLKSLMISDGLGYVGEWYSLTGSASNYHMDEIPQWVTPEGLAFSNKYQTAFGSMASMAPAGLCYDYTKMFIDMANTVYNQTGELSNKTLADFSRNQLQTGNYTFKGGIVMKEYKYQSDSVPDPVVGDGYFIFPVVQYFDGEAKVVFPKDWAQQDIKIKQ